MMGFLKNVTCVVLSLFIAETTQTDFNTLYNNARPQDRHS